MKDDKRANSSVEKTIPKVYIEPCAGLGNRLNVLWGALYWCKELKGQVEIILLWKREASCNASFGRLFQEIPELKMITFYQMGLRPPYSLRSLMGMNTENRIRKNCDQLFEPDEMARIMNADDGEDKLRKLMTSGTNVFIKSTCGLCTRAHQREVLHLLKPSEEALGTVRSIMGNYTEDRLVGIHIRRTDNQRATLESPTTLFQEKMRELKKENPYVAFYLATDDATVEELIGKEFVLLPHITCAKKVNRNTENGILDAYVDMLCLGSCSVIYGSSGSTFSRMAGFLGGKDVEILTTKD